MSEHSISEVERGKQILDSLKRARDAAKERELSIGRDVIKSAEEARENQRLANKKARIAEEARREQQREAARLAETLPFSSKIEPWKNQPIPNFENRKIPPEKNFQPEPYEGKEPLGPIPRFVSPGKKPSDRKPELPFNPKELTPFFDPKGEVNPIPKPPVKP